MLLECKSFAPGVMERRGQLLEVDLSIKVRNVTCVQDSWPSFCWFRFGFDIYELSG